MSPQTGISNAKVIVWGLAAGRRSTQGAARGALAWREYSNAREADEAIERGDWLQLIARQKGGAS